MSVSLTVIEPRAHDMNHLPMKHSQEVVATDNIALKWCPVVLAATCNVLKTEVGSGRVFSVSISTLKTLCVSK